MSPELIGSVGVGLLLLAFALNVMGRLSEQGVLYLLMNLIGAGLSAWYALASGSLPFLVLEGVWGLVALLRLLLKMKTGSQPAAENP
jgi:hypothetical protein